MKKMSQLKYTLVFMLVLSSFSSKAQFALPDRVTGTPSYLDEIVKNYADEKAYPFSPNTSNLNAKIPVRIHIIKNIKGMPGVKTSDIETSLNLANSFFASIGIRFFIDSVNVINDYNYGFIENNHLKKELLNLYATSNKINLFLADSILMGSEKTYGFTYFPTDVDSNFIFLDKRYASGKYLTTMLGHFMGLLSTHENSRGVELSSEKNCATAGDFICDTYADPNLFGHVDSTCIYSGSARDNEGRYFVPTVANIMSNTPDECKCIFTPLQYKRMYYYFLKYRQKLKR